MRVQLQWHLPDTPEMRQMFSNVETGNKGPFWREELPDVSILVAVAGIAGRTDVCMCQYTHFIMWVFILPAGVRFW